MTILERMQSAVRDIPDFPKKGILFKDITPILFDPELCSNIADEMSRLIRPLKAEGIVGIESRGFLFGMMLAERLKVPFIPVRKHGKLPYKTISHEYQLEYGSAIIEMHADAIKPGQRILIHDDLLATGGTAVAASELVTMLKGQVCGFAFLIGLDFLNGKEKLLRYTKNIISLLDY